MIVSMKQTIISHMKFTRGTNKETKVMAQARVSKALHAKVANALHADGTTWQSLIEAACLSYLEERSKNVCTTQK